MKDFPKKREVPPGEIRFGIFEGNPFYQCQHMDDIALLPTGPGNWEVLSEQPLTVRPSIKNLECGCHGFITEDDWIPV